MRINQFKDISQEDLRDVNQNNHIVNVSFPNRIETEIIFKYPELSFATLGEYYDEVCTDNTNLDGGIVNKKDLPELSFEELFDLQNRIIYETKESKPEVVLRNDDIEEIENDEIRKRFEDVLVGRPLVLSRYSFFTATPIMIPYLLVCPSSRDFCSSSSTEIPQIFCSLFSSINSLKIYHLSFRLQASPQPPCGSSAFCVFLSESPTFPRFSLKSSTLREVVFLNFKNRRFFVRDLTRKSGQSDEHEYNTQNLFALEEIQAVAFVVWRAIKWGVREEVIKKLL